MPFWKAGAIRVGRRWAPRNRDLGGATVPQEHSLWWNQGGHWPPGLSPALMLGPRVMHPSSPWIFQLSARGGCPSPGLFVPWAVQAGEAAERLPCSGGELVPSLRAALLWGNPHSPFTHRSSDAIAPWEWHSSAWPWRAGMGPDPQPQPSFPTAFCF